ncbi:MAG: hypothetical protein Q8P68_04910 [Candidatus Peregrinibacteria bacterium]|nr:hypothetical protein [Candidatus Peregrinibacteria bacterium]MDZ4245390.1 hypothetical protein [Candidatus Gracilibacteria bacterium]
MEFTYVKEKLFVSFSKEELTNMWKEAKKTRFLEILEELNIPFSDTEKIKENMDGITSQMVEEEKNDTDEEEIFIGISLLDFYPEFPALCFELKSTFKFKEESILTLNDLKKVLEKDTPTDFAIVSATGEKNESEEKTPEMRKFQHKRCTVKPQTKEVTEYIKKTLKEKYGNRLEENLVITINPREAGEMKIEYEEVHKELSKVGYENCGNMIIHYNDQNKHTVITEVYPTLRQMEISMIPEIL